MEDVFQPRQYTIQLFLGGPELDLIVSVFVSGTELLYIYIYSNFKFLKFEESLNFPHLEIYSICKFQME